MANYVMYVITDLNSKWWFQYGCQVNFINFYKPRPPYWNSHFVEVKSKFLEIFFKCTHASVKCKPKAGVKASHNNDNKQTEKNLKYSIFKITATTICVFFFFFVQQPTNPISHCFYFFFYFKVKENPSQRNPIK